MTVNRIAARIALSLLVGVWTPKVVSGQTPTPQPPARPTAAPSGADRIFVNLGGGFQLMSTTFGESHSEPLDGEQSTWNAEYTLDDHMAFLGGAAVRVHRNLLAGVTYSHQQQKRAASISGQVPHPFFFDQPRVLQGDSSSLSHQERAIHISAIWVAPVGRRFELSLAGGPSVFLVKRDFVDEITYAQEYPYDTVTFTNVVARDASERAFGGHAAAELTWLVMPHVGVSGLVRYSRGSVTLETPSGNSISLDTGGLQAGIALRLGFGGSAAAPPPSAAPRVDRPASSPGNVPGLRDW
jgi:hypothetical protein